ncbi:hypothetical protein GCM10007939_16910 [Amylibacter marinus]|uniref:L,D-TPase catalytic domain-containing protein n=1 Tax=Amylibacter marinus TaxID=1475483 RepID=A0ABQ5VVF0_9RHOB|nr:L,D-transpeptidase family protein [Amylibacter marinus]GLQ35408.1 hypothetical protein GCM10007939_16910 [Amylibacter marinus]
MSRFDDLIVSKWGARFQGVRYPVSVGRGGIGIKSGEGDGVTPIGSFRICALGYRADRVDFDAPHLFQRPIGLNDKWSDDARDSNYNHSISAFSYAYSHEVLRRSDGLYDVFGVLDYNWPDAVPGRGSAIFIHAWRKPRHRTEGCVALARGDLITILQNWQPWSRVVIRG